MRTLVALCALLAACWAAPLSPSLRPREVAGPRSLNRPFAFFESQRLPRGDAGKTTTLFSTSSNFGGHRRLSAGDVTTTGLADSSEARSEDAVASLLKSFGGSLQEKRRLDDSEESSEEEDDGPSSALAPSPAEKSTTVSQGQVAATGITGVSGGASVSVADFSPVLINTAIQQVKIPIARPSVRDGEVKIVSLTGGPSATIDGVIRTADEAVVATNVAGSAQQAKTSNGDSSTQPTAASAAKGENKHHSDCGSAGGRTTTTAALQNTPTNANNDVHLVLSGGPGISEEGAGAQGIPSSATSPTTQAATQTDSVPPNVNENTSHEQSASVISSAVAGNIALISANAAGRTPADAEGNGGTSISNHAQPPNVNVGASASSIPLVQVPGSHVVYETQGEGLGVPSVNTPGSAATGVLAVQDGLSDVKSSDSSAVSTGDANVPAVRTSSITVTLLNGKHGDTSGNDNPQVPDGGAGYTSLVNGPILPLPTPLDAILSTEVEDTVATSPNSQTTRTVDSLETVVQSVPAVQEHDEQPKGVKQSEKTENCNETNGTENKAPNVQPPAHQQVQVQPTVPAGNVAITQSGESGDNFSVKNGTPLQGQQLITTSGTEPNTQSNAVNTGESSGSDTRAAAEDEILSFLRNSAGVTRFSSQDVKPVSYKTNEGASYVGPSSNGGVTAALDTSSTKQEIGGGLKQGQLSSSEKDGTSKSGQIVKEGVPVVTDIRSAAEEEILALLKSNAAQNTLSGQAAGPSENKPGDATVNERPSQIRQVVTIVGEAQQATLGNQNQPGASTSAEGFLPETVSSSSSSRAAAEEEIQALLKTNAGQNVVSSEGVRPSSDNQKYETGNTGSRKIFRVVTIISADDKRQLQGTEVQELPHGNLGQPVTTASAESSSSGTIPATDSVGDATKGATLSLPEAQRSPEQLSNSASEGSSAPGSVSAMVPTGQANEDQSGKVQIYQEASSLPAQPRVSTEGTRVSEEVRVAAEDEILSFLRDRAAKTNIYQKETTTAVNPLIVTYGDKSVGGVVGVSVGASDSLVLMTKGSEITHLPSISKESEGPAVADSALKEADKDALPKVDGEKKDIQKQQVNIADEGTTSFFVGNDEVSPTKEKKLPVNELDLSPTSSSADNSKKLSIEISHEQKPIDVSGIFKPVVFKPATPGDAPIDVSGIATPLVVSDSSSRNVGSHDETSNKDNGTPQANPDDIKTSKSKDDCNVVGPSVGKAPSGEKELNLHVSSDSSRLSSGGTTHGNEGTSENLQIENEAALRLSFQEGIGNIETKGLTANSKTADKSVIHITVHGDEGVKTEDNTQGSRVQPINAVNVLSSSPQGSDGLEGLSFKEGKQVGQADFSLPRGTPSVTVFKIENEDEAANTAPVKLPSSDAQVLTVTTAISRQEDGREAGGEDKPESHSSGTTLPPEKSILTVISNMFGFAAGDEPKKEEDANGKLDATSQKQIPASGLEGKIAVHPDNLSVGIHRGSAVTVQAQGQPVLRLQEATQGIADGQVITSSFVGSGNVEQNPLLRDSSAFIEESKSDSGNYGQRISTQGQTTGVVSVLSTSGTPDAQITETLTPTLTEDATGRDKTPALVSGITSIISPGETGNRAAPDTKQVNGLLSVQGQAEDQPAVPVPSVTASVSSPDHGSSSPSVEEGQLSPRPVPGGSTSQIQFIGSIGDSAQIGAELVPPVRNEAPGEIKVVSGISAGETSTDYSQPKTSVEFGAKNAAPPSAVTLLHPALPAVGNGNIDLAKTFEASVSNEKTNVQKPQNTIVVHVSDVNSPFPPSVVVSNQEVLSGDAASEQAKDQGKGLVVNPVQNAGPVGRTDGGIASGISVTPAVGESSVPVVPQSTSGQASLPATSISPENVASGIPSAGKVSLLLPGTLPDNAGPAVSLSIEGQSSQQPSDTLRENAVSTGHPLTGEQVPLQPAGSLSGSAVPGAPNRQVSLQTTGSLQDNAVPSGLPRVEGQAPQHLLASSVPGLSPTGEQVTLPAAAPLSDSVAPGGLQPHGEVSVQRAGTSPDNAASSVIQPVGGQAYQQPQGAILGNAVPAGLIPVGGQVTLQPAGSLPDNAVPGGISSSGREVSQQSTDTAPHNAGPSGLLPVDEQVGQQPSGSLSSITPSEGLRPVEEQEALPPAAFLPGNVVPEGLPFAGVGSPQPAGPATVNAVPSALRPVEGRGQQQLSATSSGNERPEGQPSLEEQVSSHPAGASPGNTVLQGITQVEGVSPHPIGTVSDSTLSARPQAVEDQKNLQPTNLGPGSVPQFVGPEPAVAAPTADTLPNQSNIPPPETLQKGTITVAVDGLQVSTAFGEKAGERPSQINIPYGPSEERLKQTVTVSPISKDSTPGLTLPVAIVPVINEATGVQFESNRVPIPGTFGVNTVINKPQNEVPLGSSSQTSEALPNTVAVKPQGANGVAGDQTPATVSGVIVTNLHVDGPHSAQVDEQVKTDIKEEAGPNVDASSTSNDKSAAISSTNSPGATPTDTTKVSFVTYATEPTSAPVPLLEGSAEKGTTPTATTVSQQTSPQVSTIENVGTVSKLPPIHIAALPYPTTPSSGGPVMNLLYHGLVSAGNDATLESTQLPAPPKPSEDSAGTNIPTGDGKPSGVPSDSATLPLGQNNAQLVPSSGLISSPLQASPEFSNQHRKTPLDSVPGVTVGAAPHTTVLGDSLLSVHTPSKPTVLKLQSPYVTRFFPNQLPQHTIPPTPPAISRTPEAPQLGASDQSQAPAFTTPPGGQPHTRIFFSPPSQKPTGQQQPLAAPPYFVSFRHDYPNPNKAPFPQSPTSYATKQKVPAEVLLPHILAQHAASSEPAPGGDKGQQNSVRPQQPSPPTNAAHQANQQMFAPPSYNPGFSPQFALAPGYKGPVTTIILNPDLSSQFGSYVPRSEANQQNREGLYKVRSFVPSVSATVPGSPKYTATSFVPDKLTSSQGGQVFRVTSFVPRGSQSVQGVPGYRQSAQLVSNGPNSFPRAPGRTVYRVAPVGSRGSRPAAEHPDVRVTVINAHGRAPQQPVFNAASPQATASARQRVQPQPRFPPFRGQQAVVEVRAVPIHFEPRPAGQRVTPYFHQQPLTFYDAPQRRTVGGAPLGPSAAPVNGRGFRDGRTRFQPVAVVRKQLPQGLPSSPQPLIASAAHQAPVFHGVTRVVVRPARPLTSQ